MAQGEKSRGVISRVQCRRMAIEGLRDGVELEPEGATGRLIDRQSGLAFPVSEIERRLLERWEGARSATDVAARLFADGLDVEAPQVEVFFERLQRAGLTAPGASLPMVPDFVPPSARLDDDDAVVPSLRLDLRVRRPASARATVQVTDPVNERSFTLFDTELSVARMLDGRRTVRALITAAAAIGVPVTLETLRDFVQQLTSWRFIDGAGTDGRTTWPRRRPWSADVRRRFRQALAALRSGNADDALEPLTRIIEADPGNEEAVFLRARVRAERDGATELDVPFALMHTREDPFATLDAVTDPARKAVAGDGPRLWSGQGDGDGDEQPTHAEMAAIEAPPKPRSLLPLLVGVGVACAALAVFLFHPVDRRVTRSCTIEPVAVETVTLPEGEPRFDLESGRPVKAGQVVAHVTPSNAAEVARLTAEVRDDEAARSKLARSVAPAPKVAAAKKLVAAAQVQLAQAVAAKKKLGVAKTAAAKKKLTAAEAAVSAKTAALERARTALEALSHADALDRLARSIDTGKRALAAVTTSVKPVEVKVAHDGVWLQEGARVVASTLAVTLREKTAPPAGPLEVTLTSGPKQAVSDGVRVTLPFELSLVSSACTVSVVEGTTAWVLAH
jgi:hypothetical protein